MGPLGRLLGRDSPAALRLIVAAGAVLRLVVYVFQDPDNNDGHSQVVSHILAHGAFPAANALFSAYHPPLYYVLAVPWSFIGGPKGAQLFSTLLSILNLYVLYRLVRDTPVIRHPAIQLLCLLLAALLPPFVLFAGYVSNDSLAFLLGSLVFLSAFACLGDPSSRNCLILGLLLGLGLLTKFMFLAYAPLLLVLLVVAQERSGLPWQQRVVGVLLFCVITTGVGSYKFVDNVIHFGRPIVTNVDFRGPWVYGQRGTYVGPSSIFDVNILRLVRHPRASAETIHSYPLLLYGTFWYEHIPESNFKSAFSPRYLAPVIFVLALVPTLLMGAGLLRGVALGGRLGSLRTLPPDEFQRVAFGVLSVALLASNFALIVGAFVRYDVWSIFQARLLFPAFFSFLVLLSFGLEAVWDRHVWVRGLVCASLGLLYYAFVAYFGVEIGALLARGVPSISLFRAW